MMQLVQEARFPQLRTLTSEQRTKLKSSFVHFDDPSFCEWIRSLKVLPPEPSWSKAWFRPFGGLICPNTEGCWLLHLPISRGLVADSLFSLWSEVCLDDVAHVPKTLSFSGFSHSFCSLPRNIYAIASCNSRQIVGFLSYFWLERMNVMHRFFFAIYMTYVTNLT